MSFYVGAASAAIEETVSAVSGQRCDSHPENVLGADVDVVLADKFELPIAADAEYGKACGSGFHGVSVAQRQLHHIGRDQDVAGRVERKCAVRNPSGGCVL